MNFSYSKVCEDLDSLAIQQNGRTKPLYVHALESIRFLTGKSHINNLGTLESYCKLAISLDKPKVIIPIEHIELKKFLSIGDKKALPIEILLPKYGEIEFEARKLQETESSYKKSLNKLLSRLNLYQGIISGSDWKVAVEVNSKLDWYSLAEIKASIGTSAFENSVPTILSRSEETFSKLGNTQLVKLENFYYKSKPYGFAMIFVLLGIFFLVVLNKPTIGMISAALAVLVQLIAIILRIYISGRAPVTNMYETVLFSGFGALIISMIVAKIRSDKFLVVGGLGYNLLCLFMLRFADGMLTREIGPLVPVLRDNFWLSTHVTTVILSYAAFAIAWILANIILIKRSYFSMTDREYKYRSDLIYSCLKIGTSMLALGIILGGVWADYSWGRFWGWDPKETWSAIALCLYLAILHGKHTSWIKEKQFVPLVAAAFMSIMMAWFGVNYILASGLHSYGFSEGGAIFLTSFFTIQTLILILTYFKFTRASA